MRKICICMFLLVTLIPVFAARKALIIGNGAYTDKPLKNPVNDAKLIDATLKRVGFQTRTYTDLNGEGFDRAIIDFVKEINYSDEVFFYYSGHGIQINGENFLLPVGENIFDDVSAQRRGVSLKDDVMKRFERARLQIIVLDACRDNPFSNFRSSSKGLAQPPAEAQGYFILYSTSANSVADDGIGKNSDFTRILCKYIETPGVELNTLGKRVGKEVNEMNRNQYPDMFTRYYEDYYFTPPLPPEPAVVQTPPATVAATQPVPQQPAATQQQVQPIPTQTNTQQPVVTYQTNPAPSNPGSTNTPPKPTEPPATPKADPKPMQTASLTLPTSPHGDSAKTNIETGTSPPTIKPIPESGIEKKIASRLRYGMKVDGTYDEQPDIYPAFYPGSFSANSDIYALWQYRQAWIKAGLTSNNSDYDYLDYHIADISVRIPLVIAELHAGYVNNFSSGYSGYDLRFEKVLGIGSQLVRMRMGFGGYTADPDIGASVEETDLYSQYYYGTTLYDNGLMGFTNIQPDSRTYAGITIGNHPGVENPYYLQDAALTDLPLANAPKGAYQVDAVYSSSSMDIDEYTAGVNLYLDDGGYVWGYNLNFSMDSRVMKLGLAWKPMRNMETGISYNKLDTSQYLNLDMGIFDINKSITHLSISVAYNWEVSPAMRLSGMLSLSNKTWGMEYDNFYNSTTTDITVTRTGATLAAMLQYKMSNNFFLHAKLGMEAGNETKDLTEIGWSGTFEDNESNTLFQPKAALGIDLHFDTVHYKK